MNDFSEEINMLIQWMLDERDKALAICHAEYDLGKDNPHNSGRYLALSDVLSKALELFKLSDGDIPF